MSLTNRARFQYASDGQLLSAKAFTCPHCGNQDAAKIEANGHHWHHVDCTLLCQAVIPKGECDSFDQRSDGTNTCGMQWDPYRIDLTEADEAAQARGDA